MVQFETAWNWQSDWRRNLLADSSFPQAIWFLEHPACFTFGRGADPSNLLFNTKKNNLNLYRIDRGGDVTHHLQGQLVVYLVIDLNRYKKDLSWYLRQLEQVLIDLLDCLELQGQRMSGLTGVWCQNRKVASIGVGCRRWITQHGLALNVNCDLEGFRQINPCGLDGSMMGKLDSWIPGITIEDVHPLMKKCLEKRFRLDWKN